LKAAARVLTELGGWLILAVLIGLIAAIAAKTAKAATDPTCLTKAEARQKFPKAHLYWHTQHRCWDATPPSRANRAQYKRPVKVGQVMPVPRPQPRPQYWVVIPLTYVPAKGSFTPWDERVDGAFVQAKESGSHPEANWASAGPEKR
jgi:hypothetical protein